MNNPLRRYVQRRFQAPHLLHLGGPLEGGKALEIGCGNGVGIELILSLFHADQVDAFDLDQRMVDLARRRTAHCGETVSIWNGNACAITRPDSSYDAVFDFGVLHHIEDWRQALAEIHRVLKPGGRFYAEEVFGRFTNGFPWRQLLDHPREDRFDASGFSDALAEAGFEALRSTSLIGSFGWFVADKKI